MIVVLLRLCLLIVMASSFIALIGCDEDNGTTGNGPTVTSITPALVYPGQTNVRGTITGTGFVGIGAVDLGPDIQILKTNLISNTEITVRFTVGPNAAPGPRMITVTTFSGQGQLNGVFSIAENRAPQASFSADPPSGGRGVEITFDASASEDADGTIQLYEWDFGDGGKGEGKITSHRYDAAGNFTVTLTVTDDRQGKSTSNREIKIENTIPPVAHFNFQPQQGDTTTVFSFDGSSSTDSDGRIKTYTWEFGDGTIADGARVTHKFLEKGDFSVRLIVTDNDGLESMKEKGLKIIGRPPVASFTISPDSGTIETVFTFDSSGSNDDGRIVEYRWLIENNTFTNRIPQYSFTRSGAHEIRLTVTDNDGDTDTMERTLLVSGDDPDPDPDPDPGPGGNCSPRAPNQNVPYRAIVESFTESPRVVTVRFVEDFGCDPFYRCGDVRWGGLAGWSDTDAEKWVGVMCQFEDLGGGRARITLAPHLGTYSPEPGNKVYTWPQRDCDIRDCNGVR